MTGKEMPALSFRFGAGSWGERRAVSGTGDFSWYMRYEVSLKQVARWCKDYIASGAQNRLRVVESAKKPPDSISNYNEDTETVKDMA